MNPSDECALTYKVSIVDLWLFLHILAYHIVILSTTNVYIDICLQAVAEIILSKHFSTKAVKPVSMHFDYFCGSWKRVTFLIIVVVVMIISYLLMKNSLR